MKEETRHREPERLDPYWTRRSFALWGSRAYLFHGRMTPLPCAKRSRHVLFNLTSVYRILIVDRNSQMVWFSSQTGLRVEVLSQTSSSMGHRPVNLTPQTLNPEPIKFRTWNTSLDLWVFQGSTTYKFSGRAQAL